MMKQRTLGQTVSASFLCFKSGCCLNNSLLNKGVATTESKIGFLHLQQQNNRAQTRWNQWLKKLITLSTILFSIIFLKYTPNLHDTHTPSWTPAHTSCIRPCHLGLTRWSLGELCVFSVQCLGGTGTEIIGYVLLPKVSAWKLFWLPSNNQYWKQNSSSTYCELYCQQEPTMRDVKQIWDFCGYRFVIPKSWNYLVAA